MSWLTWRQFRVQAAVVAGALVLLAVIVVPTGLHLLDLYTSCRAAHDCASGSFTGTDGRLQTVLEVVLTVAPALIGMFWGAPLVARELETGSYRLGWTQSVTRRRWLAVKLGLVGLASVAVVGLLSLMVTWWFSPIDTVTGLGFGPFDTRDITPIGYAAFAFVLGVAAGVMIRRTVPAMATTLVGFIAVRAVVTEWVRPHLMPPAHTVAPLTQASPVGFSIGPSGVSMVANGPDVRNAWVISSAIVNASGQSPSSRYLTRTCPGLVPPGGLPSGRPSGRSQIAVHAGTGRAPVPAPGGPFQSCVDKVATRFHLLLTYQPASRYWAFQGLETALYVALALLLTGLCFWWVRHRLA
ncbi:MAG: hypothetical protein ACLPVF_05065 [Acidimicrobiales bacterium]